MQPLTLADELVLSLTSANIILDCNWPDLPVDNDNLAIRAAMAFQEATSENFGVHLR